MSDDDDKPKRKPIGPFAIVSAEIYANRKIRKAKSLGCQVFVFALTRNAARGRTGVLDAAELEAEYVADMLQISAQDAEEGVRLAIAAGLLLYEPETDTMHITGWDSTWSRAPMTEAERERKRTYREKKKTRSDGEQTQTQNRDVRDKSRTSSGVGVALSPPMSREERRDAEEVIHVISTFLGTPTYSTDKERALLVDLMRRGHAGVHLQALAAWTCADDGQGWANKTDRDGTTYMRRNCTVHGIFSQKQIDEQMSTAVATVIAGQLYDTPKLTARLKAYEEARAKGAA